MRNIVDKTSTNLTGNLTQVEELMQHQEFSVEIKYDGERSQVHKDKNQYKYFSRSGKEYSTVFGDKSIF